jgi:hypothetical protein
MHEPAIVRGARAALLAILLDADPARVLMMRRLERLVACMLAR